MHRKSQIKHRKSKLVVGVIFGGRSAEHQVSLVSATSIINALDKNKYDVVPIGIAPDGRWLSFPGILERFKSGHISKNISEKILLPNPAKKGLVQINRQSVVNLGKRLDVLFPVLHGSYGEDGTIQGLFELASIPYVGAGVLGSSVGMDKVVSKQLFQQAGIPVCSYLWFLNEKFRRNSRLIIAEIESKLKYPCFVKPANSGSSVGISKAHGRRELISSIKLAMRYDRKILVEKSVENAREIEVSVLGNDDPVASKPGEIISSNEFYDYDAKYIDGKSEAIIPAMLPDSTITKIQELAVRSFMATDCAGMARVDFLISRKTNQIYLNEINSIPGFTSISMYPKLWEVSGIPYPKLLDRLIQLAIRRHLSKKKLTTSFHPKEKWYK